MARLYLSLKRNPSWTPEKRREYQRQWRQDHLEEMRARARTPEFRQQANERNKKLREAALSSLGGVCSVCGWADVRALQIDHIEGNGNEEARKHGFARGSACFYRKVLKDPQKLEKYQVLCANHNWIKFFENKEFTATKISENS